MEPEVLISLALGFATGWSQEGCNRMEPRGYDAFSEEMASEIQAMVEAAIEEDERDGGCSPRRSDAYRAAFASVMRLFSSPDLLAPGQDIYEFFETFTAHLYVEMIRAMRYGLVPKGVHDESH